MFAILAICIDLAAAVVFLLPVVLLTQVWRKDWRRTGLLLLFALYLAAVLSATGVPSVYHWSLDLSVNFLPFVGVLESPASYLKNTVLNILLFVPLGFLLPVLWTEFRSGRRTVLFGFGLSVGIELLQLFSLRLTDVDDIIINTLGCTLGFLLARTVFHRWQDRTEVPATNSRDLSGTVLLVFLVMLLLQPLVSDVLWNLILESPLWGRLR